VDRGSLISLAASAALLLASPAHAAIETYRLAPIEDYAKVVPVYEDVPGWSESTIGAKSLSDLPQAARDYIAKIETAVGAPIDVISTGPDRVETIVLRHPFG